MNRRFFDRCVVVMVVTGSVVMVGAVAAQQSVPQTPTAETKPGIVAGKESTRKAIKPEDYGAWETLGLPVLSPDGRWLAYAISRSEGDGELRIRMLATEATEAITRGSTPRFSKDSRWLAYAVNPPEEDRDRTEKTEKAKEAPRSKVGVKNLVGGESSIVDDVASFSFSDDGKYLLLQRYPIKGRESSGGDLVVRNLTTGVDTSFGNVSSYKFNDKGTLLALAIDAEGKVGNGVQIFDPTQGTLRTLDSSPAKYTALTWRKDSTDLAVLRENDHAKDEDASFIALAWRGVGGPKEVKKSTYDFAKDERFPKDHKVVDFAGLSWSDDGQALFFGLKAWDHKPVPKAKKDEPKKDEAKKDEPKKAEAKTAKKSLRDSLKEPAGVEVWHAKDVEIMPLQQKTAARKKRESFLAAWWLDDAKLVQLGNDLTEEIVLVDGHKHAIGLDNTPHESEKKFGPTLHDVYLVDAKTGDRKKLLDRLKYTLGSSPDGRYLLYLRDKNLWTYDVTNGSHANLTATLGVPFVNQELTVLTDEKPPYGIGGWTKDGTHLLAYDRFDIWDLASDGKSARKLTDGRKDQVVARRLRIDFDGDGDKFVALDKPMLLSLTGETNKHSGIARLVPGEKAEVLAWKPKGIARLVKAGDADIFAFVEQAYDDSPDIFVDGPDMKSPRQVSQTNPFQKDFLWGRSELIDYINANGEALQGALIYPADYEPGKTYPMIVYIYERLSQQLHSYSAPSERSPYNPSVFSGEGYFVFMPDIVYRAQNPGVSAVECVIPAVKKVLESGKVDSKRVGLVGHSWGAYQTTFLATQTDIFAAAAAGAPLTNMMSMSVSIYWNSGQTNAWIFHESQGRMDRPFWQDIDTYVKNSPIFQIDKLNTPLLVTFGTEDGAVDWNQGVEMYNAARLAGKPLVMLVYPGENHGLAKKPNQVDYHYRILDWFGHHLKGQPAPKWITEGQTHLERQKELEAIEKKKTAPDNK